MRDETALADTIGAQRPSRAVVGRACFFSRVSFECLQREQYSLQDIGILRDLGFDVTIANSLRQVPFGCDLYFSWWASGSILPLVKALASRKPIIIVAGGNEATFYRDSVSRAPAGYLATPWYKKVATRLCLRLATRVLTVSHFMVKDVMALGAVNPLVVHNSVDTRRFSLSQVPRDHVTTIVNLEKGATRIKRAEVFIRSIPEVVKSFPEQKFAIIGDRKDEYERVKALAESLGIGSHLAFVGSVNNTEVATWLQRSKAYVQISDTETFGVAIAEAMSCGTPVVVSRRGAIPEVVGECGVYVDQNDPQSVAAGIVSVLRKGEEELRALGRMARRRVEEHFSYDGRKARIRDIIDDIRPTRR